MGEVRPHEHPGEPHGRLQPPEERGGGGAGPQLQQVREEGVAEDEGVAGVAGGRPRPRLARLPGLPQLARVVVGLGLVIPPAQLLLYLFNAIFCILQTNLPQRLRTMNYDYGVIFVS